MTKTTAMPPFEDVDVQRATVRITNAGDGLSEALKIQPKAIHLDDEVYYVLRGTCTQINHRTDPKDEDVVTRVHTIKASDITEVDGELAGKILGEAAEALARRKAEIDGQLMLDQELAAVERERSDLASTGSARDTQTKP